MLISLRRPDRFRGHIINRIAQVQAGRIRHDCKDGMVVIGITELRPLARYDYVIAATT